ncbi:MAG: J domain-containing protein [Deltaproteobacteria bacterium]|jgi:curved DNA-binding protein|nr:J domain-containing protein [Deltaproteobacteria bacterium]
MATTDSENLYAVLGVTSTATQAEIQTAYKQRARELHPDVNKAPDAEEKFKQLAAAYAILKDEQRRARYDAFGFSDGRRPSGNSEPRRPPRPPKPPGGRARSGFSPRDFGFGDVNFEDVKVGNDDLNNPFDFFLRRERSKRKKEREVQLAITLEHAYLGTTLNVVLDVPDENGRTETRKIRLKIPAGAKEGDRMKLKEPDVTVVLTIEPHPNFELDGRDLTTNLDITPWEAALGSSVEMATPGGPVKVRIPEGTSSGVKLRLRGQGLPVKPGKDGAPGDLYVKVKVVVPTKLSAKERDLLEQLQAVSEFNPRKAT